MTITIQLTLMGKTVNGPKLGLNVSPKGKVVTVTVDGQKAKLRRKDWLTVQVPVIIE